MPTRVEIYDQGYSIGGGNADYIERLARQVDAKMRQVAHETRVVDSLRVAVLAALNLADENEALRADLARLEGQAGQRAARARQLIHALDRAIEPH